MQCNNKKLKIHMNIKSNNDEYYTPEAAIQMLKPYLQQTKYKIGDEQCWTVWEPFIGNPYTESPKYINNLKYDCRYKVGYNFFEHDISYYCDGYCDFVISNPPYHTPKGEKNMKERIIDRLCSFNMPFCLLIPTTYLQTKSFKRMVDKYGKFQIIMPSTKIQFYQLDDNNKKKTQGKCSFYTCWFCWNMGFKHDFNVV